MKYRDLVSVEKKKIIIIILVIAADAKASRQPSRQLHYPLTDSPGSTLSFFLKF